MGRSCRVSAAHRVAAFDMAKLMGDDALNLIGGAGLFDQAAIDVDCLSASGECVDRPVANKNDFHILRSHAGGTDQRRADFSEKSLGLRIAQHALRCRRPERDNQGKDETNGSADHHAATAFRPLNRT